ncbi:MAG: Gfo/Idh/MocA family oxidoreductase [Victivallaceae bacterium]|nr:Gfo/Idh/MocA family oxidoreductase [Victivallaceae bacterium]
MEKVRIGLIGLGFMGTTHYGIYQNLPQAQLVAIADGDPAKRAGDISKVVGNIGGGDNSKRLDFSGIKTYEDPLDLIADKNVDVVDICVPTALHLKYARTALEAGKHVFCEKPVCRDRAELAELEKAVKAAKGFFNVGMCIRSWPEYAHAREAVAAGKYGKVRHALFRRLSPSVNGNAWENWYMTEKRSGGAILDLHLHDTDAVCAFFGKPDRVLSRGVRGVVSDRGIDHVITIYSYDGAPDMLVTAEGGWAADKTVPFEMSFEIVCEKATLKRDAAGYKIYFADRVETPDLAAGGLPTGWHRELDYFTRCVAENRTPDKYQTFDSIADSFRTVMSEIESVETGKETEVK